MTFSVVITTVNRPKLLEQCLTSLRLQSKPLDEIIVVDDSSDGQEIHIHPDIIDITKVIHTHGVGRSLARNAGLAAAESDYLSFLDDDDMWVRERLSVVARYFSANPQCKAAHHNVHYFAEGNSDLNPYGGTIDFIANDFETCERLAKVTVSKNDFSYLDITGDSFSLLMLDNRGCLPGAVISRRLAQAVGGYSPFLCAAEDQLFFLMIAVYEEWFHIDEPLAYVRLHQSQGSHSATTLSAILTSLVMLLWGGGMDRYVIQRFSPKVKKRFWQKLKSLLKASILDRSANPVRKIGNLFLICVAILGLIKLRLR